jgi:diguanylate cyclase (GGDEF)-like protein/PAS domain S-box-containing protein
MKTEIIVTDLMFENIKSSNTLEKLLLDNADEALFFYSLEGQILYVNPAFETITGYSVDELYEKNFIPFVHPDDQDWTMKLWDGLFKGEIFEDAEYRIIRKCGEIRWCLSTWKIVYNSDREKLGIQGKQQDITKHKQIEAELDKARIASELIANTDELTGLNNRRAFFMDGKRTFSQAIRFKHSVSVIMMDLDHFKLVNDTYGHSAGDITLKTIAELIRNTIREIDIVGRIGGEEFAFVLPETFIKDAANLGERLKIKISATTFVCGDEKFHLTASFGICSSQENGETLESILKKADKALYLAKNSGRNQIKICK